VEQENPQMDLKEMNLKEMEIKTFVNAS